MNKKVIALQISLILVLSVGLGYMFAFTDVYAEVFFNIVSVTCLSCIKLQPVTSTDFTFNTANNKAHPDFVVENLSNGPVFLAYRTNVCEYCDEMDPVLMDIFNVSYTVEDAIVKKVKYFDDTPVTFIHINKDRVDDVFRLSQDVYDKDKIGGVPMFTVVTIGYDRGNISEYYTSVYGVLGFEEYNDRKQALIDIIDDGVRLYNEFGEGYNN